MSGFGEYREGRGGGGVPPELPVSPKALATVVGAGVLLFLALIFGSQATEVVEPGNRGVRVTLGKVSPTFENEGLVIKAPFVTAITQVSIRQQTDELQTACYSSDLQQVRAALRILYRIPEASVVELFQMYEGNVFASLVAPRVVEALKEVASRQSAEMIVQNRDFIKVETLGLVRSKIGNGNSGGPLVTIEDITLSDLSLSSELNAAIEQKMTQREEAERARFVLRQTEIEAETAIIRARGEAESIQIRGQALRKNPAFIQLQVVERWDGNSPLVVGGEGGAGSPGILVPLLELQRP
jgi:prohibitin 2